MNTLRLLLLLFVSVFFLTALQPAIGQEPPPPDPMVIDGELTADDETRNGSQYVDWYTVMGNTGDDVRIALTAEFDTYLIVESPSGETTYDDDGGGELNSLIETVLTETGPYRVGATTYGGNVTGAYRLTITGFTGGQTPPPPPDPQPPIPAPAQATEQRLDGTLTPDDETRDNGAFVDWYEVDGFANEEISIAVNSDEFDCYVLLETPTGETLSDDDGGPGLNSLLQTTLSMAGKYRIGVTSFSAGARGAYTIIYHGRGTLHPAGAPVQPAPDPVMPPTGAATLEGRLETGDEVRSTGQYVDWHPFSASMGAEVTIDLTSDEFDTYLLVTTPSGQMLRDDDGGEGTNSRLTFTVNEQGNYRAGASSYSSGTEGVYRMDIAGGAFHAQGVQPTPPSIIQGTLGEGDVLRETGVFIDWYRLHGTAGDQVTLSLVSEDFDCLLILQSPSGQEQTNDDGGEGLNSYLETTLRETGVYRVGATSYSTASGAYSLEFHTTGTARALEPEQGGDGPTPPPPPPGTQGMNGELTPQDERRQDDTYVDWYEFLGTAGAELRISLESDDFDCYLILRAPSGSELSNDDGGEGLNSLIETTLSETGTYTIGVSCFSAATGAYYLEVTGASGVLTASDGSQPVIPNPPGDGDGTEDNPFALATGTTAGALSADDARIRSGEFCDWYTFEGTAGQRIRLAMQSSAIDTYLIFITPSGEHEDNDDDPEFGSTDSLVELILPETGTYWVGATSYSTGETGSYSLTFAVTGGADLVQPGRGTPIALGQQVRGALSAEDSQRATGEYADSYLLTLETGQVVRVTMQADDTSDLDCYLIAIAPNGGEVFNDDVQSGNLNSGLSLRASNPGVYTIICTSYAEGMTGGYTLAVAEGSADAPVVGPAETDPGVTYYGIFCGISDYPGGWNDLNFCREDAEKLAQAFQETGLMDNSTMQILVDADCTTANIRRAFERVARSLDDDDVFVFFYSGHGNRGPEGSFPGEVDGRQDLLVLYDEEMVDDDLNALLGTLNSNALQIIAIDACFSGGFSRDVVSRPNRVGYFSSEEDMTSLVAGEFEAGGYLSLFFRQAIQGEADLNRDGDVTVGEVTDFIIVQYVENVHTGEGGRARQRLVYDRGTVDSDTRLYHMD